MHTEDVFAVSDNRAFQFPRPQRVPDIGNHKLYSRSISPGLSLDMGPNFAGGGRPLSSGPYDTISMKRARQPTGGESHGNGGSIGPLRVPAVSFQGPCKSDNQSTLGSGEGREWVHNQ